MNLFPSSSDSNLFIVFDGPANDSQETNYSGNKSLKYTGDS